MIKFKDLQNRIYNGRECIRFEYGIMVDDKYLYAKFDKQQMGIEEWNMQVIIGRTRDKDSEVYNFGYIMPRTGLALELVAATGLKYFQLYLKQEIQYKSNLDFTLGNILQDM